MKTLAILTAPLYIGVSDLDTLADSVLKPSSEAIFHKVTDYTSVVPIAFAELEKDSTITAFGRPDNARVKRTRIHNYDKQKKADKRTRRFITQKTVYAKHNRLKG